MKKLICLLALVMLVGCATAKVTLYESDVKFTPTEAKDIRVYRRSPSERKYIKIGEVSTEAAQWSQIEDILKKEASKLGGEAVYITTGEFVGEKVSITGVVIKFKE